MKLLKFSANWCRPCGQLADALVEAGVEAPIEVVDVDQDPEKTKEFAVRGVPTMILLSDDGKEVTRKVGALSPLQVQTWLATYGCK